MNTLCKGQRVYWLLWTAPVYILKVSQCNNEYKTNNNYNTDIVICTLETLVLTYLTYLLTY